MRFEVLRTCFRGTLTRWAPPSRPAVVAAVQELQTLGPVLGGVLRREASPDQASGVPPGAAGAATGGFVSRRRRAEITWCRAQA